MENGLLRSTGAGGSGHFSVTTMSNIIIDPPAPSTRRSFPKNGVVASAAGAGLAILPKGVFAQEDNGGLTKGDAALLRFAAAAEILESDFWIQYNELGGVRDKEVQGGTGNPVYTAKLKVLDSDFPQYIHDSTDDEITHFIFLNAYPESKGANGVNLDQFRTLKGSTATGVTRT